MAKLKKKTLEIQSLECICLHWLTSCIFNTVFSLSLRKLFIKTMNWTLIDSTIKLYYGINTKIPNNQLHIATKLLFILYLQSMALDLHQMSKNIQSDWNLKHRENHLNRYKSLCVSKTRSNTQNHTRFCIGIITSK